MSGMRQAVGILAVAVVALLPVSACSVVSRMAHKAAAQGNPTPMPTIARTPLASKLIGYTTPNFPHDVATFQQVEKATGIHARIASWYTPMTLNFDPVQVAKISAQGVLPLLEIDSDAIPLTQVADGAWDKHFIAYARAVAAYSSPIAIDFDHEFNGPWFKWGYKYTSPAVFVAAWRRIVTIFRENGATNVTWIWNPNVKLPSTTAIEPWYPGNQYVTYVGLDGYFSQPSYTFTTVFAQTLTQVSTFSDKSILITETGVGPGPQRAAQIDSLFQGLEATPQIIGFIWFDYNKSAGHDWALQGDPKALSAFHADAVEYQKKS